MSLGKKKMKRMGKKLQVVQRVLGYAFPLSSRKKFNRHLSLLTLALNREDVQDISAVVRVRRCPSRASCATLSLFSLRRPCHEALCLVFAFLGLLLHCIFSFQDRRRG